MRCPSRSLRADDLGAPATRKRRARRAGALAAALAASLAPVPGCATGQPAPAAGAAGGPSDRLRLSALLLDASDSAAVAFDNEVASALIANAPPREIYSYMLSRATATSNIRALALGADPAGALVDLYVYSDLALWACENRVRASPTTPLVPCGATFGVLREEITAIAREFMTAEQVAKVDAVTSEWKRSHEGQLVVGLIRLSDIAEGTGTAPVKLEQVAPSLLSPVTEAAQQLDDLRLLGYKALWLASRIPTSVGWQLDATAYAAMTSQPATRAISGIEALNQGLGSSQRAIESVGTSNAALSERLEGVSQRLEDLESSVEGLDAHLDGISSAVASLAQEAGELKGADTLATRVLMQATWSGIAIIVTGAASLALVLWSHRHHSRRIASKRD